MCCSSASSCSAWRTHHALGRNPITSFRNSRRRTLRSSSTLEAYTSAAHAGNSVDVLLNGDQIFPAALEAIRSARKTKTMTVDGIWATVGSTNLDTRSFALNDEVNAVVITMRSSASSRRSSPKI